MQIIVQCVSIDSLLKHYIISVKLSELKMMLAKIFVLLLLDVNFSFGNFNFEKNLLKTWRNSTFYAFRGIKYAEAPIGSLRFKVSRIQIQYCLVLTLISAVGITNVYYLFFFFRLHNP